MEKLSQLFVAISSMALALPPVHPALPSVAHIDTETVTNLPFTAAGTLVWKAPIGWKRLLFENDPASMTSVCDHERFHDASSRPLLIGGRTDAYTQTFRIYADGTMSVEKFGWRLIRTRWSIWGTVERIE